jgi:hypothetical protein
MINFVSKSPVIYLYAIQIYINYVCLRFTQSRILS